MFNVFTLTSYPANQNQITVADNSRGPCYGEEGAVLLDFRQRHRPHKTLVEAIGDDKTAMKNCPIWGIHWSSAPPGPLPDENKRNYLSRRARKQRRRMEAKMNAKVKVRVRVKVNAKARVAILKSGRERKPERPRPLCRTVLIVLPKSADKAPATIVPAPEPPTTQSTMPNKGNAPASYLPQVMAQAFSATPSSTPMEHRPRGPPPTLITFFPPSHLPSDLERMRNSGGPSQHALPGNLFVPQGCLHSAAQEVGAAPAPLLQPPKLPNRFAPSPCHLTPCVVERLEQYAASAPIPPSHPSSQNQNMIGTVKSGAESTFTVVNAHGTFTTSATPSLYSDAGSRSPSMDLTPSPWSAGAQTSGSMLSRTTQGFAGGTDYVSAVCRDFSSPADRRLSSTPSSDIVRGLTPELVECYLATAQKMGVMHVPRAFPPAIVDNPVNATSFPRVGKQDSRGVREVAQGVYPTYSVGLSSPLAVAPHTDRPRSGHIGGMDNMYVYSQDVSIQHQRALPPSAFDVAVYPPKQNSYSELSLALQEPAPISQNQHARTSVESMGKRAWAMVPQEANVGFEPPYGSTFGRYQQGLIVDYPQSEMAMSTHLWSQNAYNSPQYAHNARTSTSAMEMMA